MNPSTLFWSVVFSAVGLGYLMYGKKQQKLVPLLAGLALVIYPYFVSNVWLMVGIGVALVATPYFVRFE